MDIACSSVNLPVVETKRAADTDFRVEPSGPSPSWREASVVLALSSAILLLMFLGTASSAVRTWYGSTAFNHAFLILPISGYLLWQRRESLARLTPRPDYRGLVLVAGLAFIWFLGETVGAQVVQQFALIGMIQALFFTVLGWRVTRAMIFPLAYLLFAVPFGDFMVPPLQNITGRFVVEGLKLTGVPVFSDGLFISIPNGNFRVAEACSGVRFLIATLALGTLCAEAFFVSWRRRIAFMALAIIVPIVANGIRAYGIVLLAYLTSNTVAVMTDHIIYGWIFFAFITLVLLFIARLFRDRPLDAGTVAAVMPGSMAAPAVSSRSLAIAGVCALLVAATAPAYAVYTESRLPRDAVVRLATPTAGPTWTAVDDANSAWWPPFPGADANLFRHYRAGGRGVDLYIAYYTHQRQGAEVVQWQNRFSTRGGWTRIAGGRARVVIDGDPLTVSRTRLVSQRKQQKRVVFSWYWVDGTFTANPIMAKLLRARARLLGAPAAAAMISVASDYRDQPSEAIATLRAFLKGLAPLKPLLIKAAMPGGGAG